MHKNESKLKEKRNFDMKLCLKFHKDVPSLYKAQNIMFFTTLDNLKLQGKISVES